MARSRILKNTHATIAWEILAIGYSTDIAAINGTQDVTTAFSDAQIASFLQNGQLTLSATNFLTVDDGAGTRNIIANSDFGDLGTVPETSIGISAKKVLYVSKDGDVTDGNGSINRPFTTIQAAIDQIATNADNSGSQRYEVAVGPGSYTGGLDFSDANLVDIVFTGDGASIGTTAITSTATNTNLESLMFQGFFITSAITLTGATTGGTFGDNGFFFRQCAIVGGISCTNVIELNIERCYIIGGTVALQNVSTINILDGRLAPTTTTLTSDNIADKPSGYTEMDFRLFNAAWGDDVTFSQGGGSTSTILITMKNSELGLGANTLPSYGTINATNSYLVGTWTNSGAITLNNSSSAATLTGTVTANTRSELLKNTSTVTGTTVDDALEQLDSDISGISTIPAIESFVFSRAGEVADETFLDAVPGIASSLAGFKIHAAANIRGITIDAGTATAGTVQDFEVYVNGAIIGTGGESVVQLTAGTSSISNVGITATAQTDLAAGDVISLKSSFVSGADGCNDAVVVVEIQYD